MADNFKNRKKGKSVPTPAQTKKRVQDFTSNKVGRPKNTIERVSITTTLDKDLKQYLRIQSAEEERPINEILEDAVRLYQSK